jgi:23S rRNA pseudouridine1911/1915/1917 synthase
MDKAEILYEDKALIVAVKPPGMPSQPDRSLAMDMVSFLKNHLAKTAKGKGEPYLAVVHRLDRPVGGVMVYAKTKEAAAALSAQIQKGTMQKSYQAVLTGVLTPKAGTLTDYLVKTRDGNFSEVCTAKTPGAKKAELKYKVIRTRYEDGVQYALVDIDLLTGRHHQIRVQMAHAGTPLYGDTRYNPAFKDKAGWSDLALFAYKLTFTHPVTKKVMTFEAKPGDAITAHFQK